MNSVIENFYVENKISPILLRQKQKMFERNPDIAAEFEQWILNKTYKTDDAVSVESYTARKLSEISEYLDGEGAFMMLVELRENPRKAVERMKEGFKRK